MSIMRKRRLVCSVLALGALLVVSGCYDIPNLPLQSEQSPAPLRMPSPVTEGEGTSYEDSLTGGQVFKMYCSYCHNAPTLGERPFSNFTNVAAHMRVRASLTGKEYDKLLVFLRRWHDVPGPDGVPEPSPTRLSFSQPLSELRPQPPADDKKEP
jgi:hypothetical protein